jgi:hypothetical protein
VDIEDVKNLAEEVPKGVQALTEEERIPTTRLQMEEQTTATGHITPRRAVHSQRKIFTQVASRA